MAARKHLAIEKSILQRIFSFFSIWRVRIPSLFLGCLVILFTANLSAQETTATTTVQSTTTETTAPVDAAVVPVEPPAPKNVASASALAAAGLTAGDGGGLPGVSGGVPGMAKVEATGGVSYAIPIVVPPGRAGIQPSLAFVYNSQGGNGLLGMGWSISGLPTIHRCPKRLEPDGISGGISYTSEDRYCMDGARLMVVNGYAYGANGAEYRTEVDNGIKIVSVGQSASGPASFVATTKEGKILEFGNGGNSDIQAVGRSDIRVWGLSSIRDTKGNTLTVTYTKDSTNGHYNPNQISYTSNTNLQANRFVVFNVEDRPDTFPMYLGGSVITVAKRITHVTTYVGGTGPANLVRDYKLTYECNINDCNTVTKRSRLKTISECDKNGNCLPVETPQSVSYTFSYQEGGNSTFDYHQFDVNDYQFDHLKVWTGDVNADGRMDILSYNNNHIWSHLSDGAGNFTGVGTYVQSYAFDGTKLWTGDFNGDGRADFATFSNGKIWTYLAKNDDSGYFEAPIQYNPQTWQIDPSYVWVADINGDGRMDLVSRKNGQLHTYISNFSAQTGNFNTPISTSSIADYQFDRTHVWPGDYNGDGKQDLLSYKNGNLWAILSNGAGDYSAVSTAVYDSNFNPNRAWSGDFNADGVTDIASYQTGVLNTYLSKADGSFAAKVSFNPNDWQFADAYTWAIDVNGDGKTDLISNKNGWLYAHYSKGDGTYWAVGTQVYDSQFNHDYVWLGDFTGDGKGDLVSGKDGKLHTLSANISDLTNMFPDLLTTIDNMFGGRNSIVYNPLTKPLPDGSAFYTKDTGADASPGYPVMDVQVPMYAVSSMVATDLGNPTVSYSSSYLYGGNKAHLRGRGSLGFRITDTLDASAGARTIKYFNQGLDGGLAQFNQNFPKVGTLDTVDINDTACSAPNDARVDSRNFYDVSSNPYPNSGVRRVLMTQTDKYEYECTDTPRYTNITFAYDTFGNLTHTYRHGVTGTADDIDEVTDWVVNSALWIHRPKTVQLFGYEGMTYRKFREKWLYYDNLNLGDESMPFGLLTKEEGNADSGNQQDNPVTTYVYHSTFGVLTSVSDPRNCQTTTAYEATWTFPNLITTCANISALNFSMSYTYDANFGVKTDELDWNGQPSGWRYDSFGRLIKMFGPLDSENYPTASYSYINWGLADQRVETKRRIEHGQNPVLTTKDQFDGFGRVDYSESDGPKGQTIVTQSRFDSRNLMTHKWVPFFLGQTPLNPILFYYDALGRETQMLHPDNRSATRFYTPGAITFTDERGVQKIHILDAHGRLAQVQEKNNNGNETYLTDYAYDAAGSLTLVRNNENHYTTMKYDLLGRKEAMCDPNMGASPSNTTCTTSTAGAWTYTYFPAGDLKTQKDAKNQTLCFAYDELGRAKTKKELQTASCDTTVINLVEWTYDTTQATPPFATDHPVGRLTKVVQPPRSITTRFAYDAMGRTAKSERDLLGDTYAIFQTYDALSRLTHETFRKNTQDSDTFDYDYNNGPWLDNVPGYINDIEYNARGQKTSLTYYNNVTTSWTYYESGSLINLRVKDRVTGNGSFQDLTYGYDRVGNVTSIDDHMIGGTAGRTFQYDDLSRLIYAQGAFGTNQSNQVCDGINNNNPISYDSIGNLMQKCNSQAFVYNDISGKHPSAVTFNPVTGKPYEYDNNGNMHKRGSQTLEWDIDNRVISVSIPGATTTMEYDYTGQRMKKFSPSVSTPALFPFEGYEIDSSGNVTKFIKIGTETFAAKKTPFQGSASKLFYHNDHLGSVNMITNEGGTREELIEYDPWGSVSKAEGPTPGSQPTADLNHRFNGKELDPETGLYYYGARYYDSEISRFVSPDPVVPTPGNPQSLNRYSYVINNPQNYVDPTGNFLEALLALVVTRLVKSIAHNPGAFFGALFAGIVTGGLAYELGAPAMLIGALAGAAAGAASSGISGGKIWEGVLIGTIAGAVGGGVGSLAAKGAELAAGALAGGATAGAISTALHGGNFFKNVVFGGLESLMTAGLQQGGVCCHRGNFFLARPY
jgi:RHS repeat-associated protein